MKFLVFNLAVAAALVYLFTADRSAVQQAAGRLHDAAGEARAIAERAVDQGRRLIDATQSTGEPRAEHPVPPTPTLENSPSVPAAAPPAPVAPTEPEPKSRTATNLRRPRLCRRKWRGAVRRSWAMSTPIDQRSPRRHQARRR